MSTSRLIEKRIEKIEPTKVFTIEDLDFPHEWWENVRVKLGRMVKQGLIDKVGRGKYYKPKLSVFGAIGPDQSEIVKDLLYDNGKISGYLTGYSIWGQMGLTSQISNIIVVGTSRRRDPMKRGIYKVRFIIQPNRITIENIHLLQILDSLKLIKQIPDTTIDKSVEVLIHHISKLDEIKLNMLVKTALKYPPRVRALLGAILDTIGNDKLAFNLKNSLNPTTTYAIGVSPSLLKNLQNWNIE